MPPVGSRPSECKLIVQINALSTPPVQYIICSSTCQGNISSILLCSLYLDPNIGKVVTRMEYIVLLWILVVFWRITSGKRLFINGVEYQGCKAKSRIVLNYLYSWMISIGELSFGDYQNCNMAPCFQNGSKIPQLRSIYESNSPWYTNCTIFNESLSTFFLFTSCDLMLGFSYQLKSQPR